MEAPEIYGTTKEILLLALLSMREWYQLEMELPFDLQYLEDRAETKTSKMIEGISGGRK